jgi:alkylation response protein AidB-like acyl-CoA dehydrogenase
MNLSLDESQRILVATFAEMLRKECPTSLVRGCEHTGFSAGLWERYCELGAHLMGLPEAAGGLAMGLLELGLVATQSGRALAPVPFVEVASVGRLLARVAPDDPRLAALAEGRPAASLAIPRPHAVPGTGGAGCSLVPFGALVDAVVALEDATLFVAEPARTARPPRIRDLGSGALAHWDLAPSAHARVLASGETALREMAAAVAEWKLLSGFWLTGIAQRALEIGADYARERIQFGTPIGGFQAIAHPLAECAMRVDGAELLCWEAAWAHSEDPRRFAMLASMAFGWASQTALRTTEASLHTHGGYGFSTEYDIQLYFRRARALSSIAGGAREELQNVAERCFDPDGSGSAEPLLGGT